MSEGNTDKYVNVENYLSRPETGSWADETEEDHEREAKPRAWATVSSVADAPNLAAIQAEEEKAAAKAAAEAAKRVPYKNPQKSHQPSYENPERHYEPRDRNIDRAPREKQPVPKEPPFTAFIGNLAYDVSEDDIMEYFGELGVNTIRLLKDPSGKPKGFGYIEFNSAEGLTNSLLANEKKLKGRNMNLDVAKPQQASSNSWGSSGSRDRNSSSRPSFNNNRSDTTWGPGPGGRESFKDNRPSSFNRPPPSTERPKLNINAPKPPQSPREPPKNKPSQESIFGVSMNDEQRQKMDKVAEERLKKEMERDAQRESQRREQDKRDKEKMTRSPRTTGRGDTQAEDRSASSWRGKQSTNVKPPYNMNYARQDDNSRPTGRGPQKPVVDSEGFRGQTSRPGHNRAWENQGTSSRSQDTQTKNQNPKESQNKFASLEGDEE